MERLFSHAGYRSTLLLPFTNPGRYSSLKSTSFDFKIRSISQQALGTVGYFAHGLNATNLAAQHLTNVSPLVTDTTYVSLSQPDPQYPLPGRIGPILDTLPILMQKTDTRRYGTENTLISNELLTAPLPVDHQKDAVGQLTSASAKVLSAKHSSQFVSNFIAEHNLEVRAQECPTLLCYELHKLFLNYNVLMQPLTALTVVWKTTNDMSKWSSAAEKERNELTDQFVRLSREICASLGEQQYWADFIDPSSGRPYYGPQSNDALFETDERFRYLGINIVDWGCCRVIEHIQHGTHVFVGSIFTSAQKNDPNIQHLLKEFSEPMKNANNAIQITVENDPPTAIC